MNDMRDMIRDTAGRLFADQVDRVLWQAGEDGELPAAAWQACTEIGLPRLLLDEASGGTGLSPAEGLSLVELAGYYALPLPLAETIVGTLLLDRMGRAAEDKVVTLAGVSNLDAVRVARTDEGWLAEGRLRRVAWARHAGYVVADAESADGETYRVVIPGSRLEWSPDANLAGAPRDSACLDGLRLEAAAVQPLAAATPTVTHWGALLRALQMAGAMRRALELAVDHANERKQFGRPIARFQAVQQQLAAMAGEVATAGAAAESACRGLDGEDHQLPIAIAKARVGEAASSAAAIAHQVHAAMGFTREHTLHYYTRRLWSWRDEFGAEPYWQAIIGERVCATGGAGLWPLLTGM